MLLSVTVLSVVRGQLSDAPVEGTLRLSTQGELPLTDLIQEFSSRIGITVVFDEAIGNRQINLVAPDPIPVSSLSDLLQTILLNEGLVITEPDARGVRRVVTSTEMPRVSRPSLPSESLLGIETAVPITRVFVLGDTRPSEVATLLTPFLSGSGASVVPLDRSGLLLVTDVAGNIVRAERLLELLDGKQAQIEIEFVPVSNVAALALAEQLTDIFAARRRARGEASGGPNGSNPSGDVEISAQERTNSLIVVGTVTEIQRVKEIAKQLDQALPTTQRTFSVQYLSAEKLDEVVRAALASRSPPAPYQSRVENNVLIVDTTAEVLQMIEMTRQQLDTRVASESQSPVRYYRIKNVPAEELAETVRGVAGQVTASLSRRSLPNRRRTSNDAAVPGPNRPVDLGNAFGLTPGAAQPVQIPPLPPSLNDPTGIPNDPIAQAPRGQFDNFNTNETLPLAGFQPGFPATTLGNEDTDPDNILSLAEIAVDVNTNTIIVVAAPEVQRIYADLIERLDQRRPQVLIEARVVIIDTSDNYTLGVEIGGGDRAGATRLFAFSSYGLSTVGPATGSLQVLPGVGFNGTLVDPQTADVVVRALANHRKARVLSNPRILVNDNAEGQLTSVLEVPFTSVNASQTVATTSFAGFAEAGTTITVTPTISEDNYLQLDYIVTLNSFTGIASEGVPPPRQTNEVRSRVSIPDGYTVIVGGLTSKNEAYEIDSIPFLEQIPLIKDLLSLQTNNWSQTSLFVFLKPVILRDDKFKDLRFHSDQFLGKAEETPNYPGTEPLLLR